MDKDKVKTAAQLQVDRDYKDILYKGRSAVKDLGYVPRNHKKCDGTGVQGSKMLYDPKIKKKRRYIKRRRALKGSPGMRLQAAKRF